MKTNNTLYVMCGLPGSGKSYQAEQLARQPKTKIVSSDAIREELYGDANIQGDGTKVFELMKQRTHDALAQGYSVVYDACNISSKHRRQLLREMNKFCENKVCVFVARLFDDCVKAQDNRDRKVPVDAIKRMYTSFQMPHINEGFDKVELIYTDKNPTILGTPEDYVQNLMDFNQHNYHHSFTLGEHLKRTQHAFNMVFNLNSAIPCCTATLIHDIGKPDVKTNKNSKGEITTDCHYYNHAEVSAYLSLFLDKRSIKYSKEI